VLQRVAACWSVLHRVVRCNVLQCVAMCSSAQARLYVEDLFERLQRVAACCSVLHRVAACCSVLQRVSMRCNVLQCAGSSLR